MIIETQAVGPFFKNGFVVGCEDTREAVLIDPGDEVEGLLAFAERDALAIRHILLTHAHVDHVTGVAAAKRALGVPVYLHRDDLFLYERRSQQAAMFGLRMDAPPPPDIFYTAGQAIAFGDTRRGRITRRATARAASACRLAKRAPQAISCLSATRCLPARSAAPICRAATTTRSSARSGPCCSRSETRRWCIPATARARRLARSAARIRFLI